MIKKEKIEGTNYQYQKERDNITTYSKDIKWIVGE